MREIQGELDLHPSLIAGFEKIYAFTGDESGVRHALMGEERVGHADAKFMLVACSAFSNLILEKKANT